MFLLLKFLKWDVERRIRRAKMIEQKELHFPGFREKFQQTMEKYYGHLAADYAKRLHDKELAALALDFNNAEKWDLREIVMKFTD